METVSILFFLLQSCPSVAAPVNQALFVVSQQAQNGFLWSSVGLAVLTALLQGLVTALAFMTESSNYWTFRFRVAKIEHWWWTVVSALLLMSLVLITLTFLSGNNNEAISILALSTATFLTIVQYMIPSWLARRFIENRWLAWTGSSRTTIAASKAAFCGDRSQWENLSKEPHISNIKQTPSDWYGWRLWPAKGLYHDPTDLLRNVKADQNKSLLKDDDGRLSFTYHSGDDAPQDVSLLWGEEQGFRRRVSRATSSMPSGLLKSRPFTIDGYVGDGLCLAMGILGRNKGLKPANLVFDTSKKVATSMENFGTWAPRPNKVLRSYYSKALEEQYGGLGAAYVGAATELALLMMDVPPAAVSAWLRAGLEHQSIEWNRELASVASQNRNAELKAHYESSYVSMIISLNYMDGRMETSADERLVSRPDIICTGLLLKARDQPEPLWWNNSSLADARKTQIDALQGDWKSPMALLLGLPQWPNRFEEHPSIWDG